MRDTLKALMLMLSSVSADFADLFKTLGNVPADLANRLSTLTAPMRTATRGLLTSIKTSPLVVDFVEMFKTLANVPADLKARAMNAANWMDSNSTGKWWKPAWDGAKRVGSSIGSAASSGWSSTGAMANSLKSGISSAFSSAGLGRLVSGLGAALQPLQQFGRAVAGGIGSGAGILGRGLAGAARMGGGVAGGVLRGVAGIGQGMIQVAGRAASVISPEMGAALTRLGTAAGPAGAAAGLIALYAAIVGLPVLLKAFGNSIAESRRGMVNFNNIIAGAFGAYDARGITRNIASADRTSGTTAFMLQTQSDVFDDLQKPIDELTNIGNLTWALTSSILNEVVKLVHVGKTLEAVAKGLGILAGVDTSLPNKIQGGQDFGRDVIHGVGTQWRPARPPIPPIGGP